MISAKGNKKIEDLFQISTIHLQNLLGEKGIFKGSFTYKDIDLKDNIFMLFALNRINAPAISKMILIHILNKYKWLRVTHKTSLSIENLGQILIGIYDYFVFSQDYSFLERNFPFIESCFAAINRSSLKSKIQKSPFSNLFRKNLTNNNQYIDNPHITDAFWAFSGVKAIINFAKILEKHDKEGGMDIAMDYLDSL